MSKRQEQYSKTFCHMKRLIVKVIEKKRIIQCKKCELKAVFDAFHTCEIWELTGLLTYKDNHIHNTKQFTRELYHALIHLEEINLHELEKYERAQMGTGPLEPQKLACKKLHFSKLAQYITNSNTADLRLQFFRLIRHCHGLWFSFI